MPKRHKTSPRPRLAVPKRVAKHIARLDLLDPQQYLGWCARRGFRVAVAKTWEELELEWRAHCAELTRARVRVHVDRDPEKQLLLVSSGQASAQDISRPRWRALAQRIESAAMNPPEQAALRRLLEVAVRRSSLLLSSGRLGDVVCPLLDGLIGMARCHGHWIREPRDWRPRSHNVRRQFASLARHLFAEYAVPSFLDSAWVREGECGEQYRVWYITAATGGSLRKLPGPLPLTRRLVHHFLRAPEACSIEQALRWGQIHALGGDARLAGAILESRIGGLFEHEDFWCSVVRFFIGHPRLDRASVRPVIDYLHAQRFERRDVFVGPGRRELLPPAQPNLSMAGRSPESLLRQVSQWHRTLSISTLRRDLRWDPSRIGTLEVEVGVPGRSQRVWRIRELCSASELRAEGATMRHCVAGYAKSCVRGHSSIWTLELHSFGGVAKHQTIEVSNQQIVQCRGRGNRLPTAQERQLVRRWAAQEGLRIARLYGWEECNR
jgi:hypothetical protein